MSPHHTERGKDMRSPLLIHYWALEVGAAQVIEEMRARALWLMNGELIENGPGPPRSLMTTDGGPGTPPRTSRRRPPRS